LQTSGVSETPEVCRGEVLQCCSVVGGMIHTLFALMLEDYRFDW